MKKQSFGMFGSMNTGPTLGTLEHKIMTDARLNSWERSQVRQIIRQETRNAPSSTPLKSILPGLGGGALGYLVAKYFSMGGVGQAISTMAGFGIGKTIANFYNAASNINDTRHQMRTLGQW